MAPTKIQPNNKVHFMDALNNKQNKEEKDEEKMKDEYDKGTESDRSATLKGRILLLKNQFLMVFLKLIS